ncbi:hypothetical protein N7468_008089 [Penicillium chermesinum]|uniref:Uncharacterized protein n=1 Tax=Penicillium chermesinum TaxID=63820 RepID=A0A9W9THY7_9EURO|nr:uncharacterized protein N7468_008089 [Penicillium chermesinum]KAJ5223547.1 hypothetical protein N7468_008089 [Penicillium chermesinum]KAJ6155623.1 hypothetical protein N7470_006189 [Penicillium chermesinum]
MSEPKPNSSESEPVLHSANLPPFYIQPARRIESLKRCLETELGQIQRVNIEALIKMYESGET